MCFYLLPGDAIGIYPDNREEDIDEVLHLTGWNDCHKVDVPKHAYQPTTGNSNINKRQSNWWKSELLFTRESSYCFWCILAVTILSVRLSITWVDQSKAVQDKITKFSPSAAWKTLVSGTIKLFHKFEGGHLEQGC